MLLTVFTSIFHFQLSPPISTSINSTSHHSHQFFQFPPQTPPLYSPPNRRQLVAAALAHQTHLTQRLLQTLLHLLPRLDLLVHPGRNMITNKRKHKRQTGDIQTCLLGKRHPSLPQVHSEMEMKNREIWGSIGKGGRETRKRKKAWIDRRRSEKAFWESQDPKFGEIWGILRDFGRGVRVQLCQRWCSLDSGRMEDGGKVRKHTFDLSRTIDCYIAGDAIK